MADVDATISLLCAQPARTALFVDFDGSLAPIVDHPADAVAHPDAAAVLAAAAAVLGRVAVVSGRPVDFLAERLPAPGVLLAGLYGFETLVDGARRLDPRAVAHARAVALAADEAEARLPGVLVERKAGVSVTLHWRTTPEREGEVRALAAELARRHGLDAPQRGKMAVELRPPVPVDKGTTVDALIDGFAVAAFAGDDAGDVPAFDAITRARADGRLEHAVCIGVLSDEAPEELTARADVVVAGPGGLVALLRAVVERAQSPA